MKPQDHAHLDRILKATLGDTAEKYIKGNKEHAGNLQNKPCLDYLLHEVTDLNVYARTAIEQRERAIEMLKIAKTYYGTSTGLTMLSKIYNLLKYGNEDGTVYED